MPFGGAQPRPQVPPPLSPDTKHLRPPSLPPCPLVQMKAVAAVEIESDLEEFEELQKVVNGYLHQNSSSEAVRW